MSPAHDWFGALIVAGTLPGTRSSHHQHSYGPIHPTTRKDTAVAEKLLLTPTEAAQALGIGRSKLYELLRSGLVPSVRIGTCRRIPADALATVVARLREATAS